MDNFDSALDGILRERGISFTWPGSVLQETESLKTLDRSGALALSGYQDRTDLPFITIDNDDARDFDDAICCTREGGLWKLNVAIADVSSFVLPGSAIDQEAASRGTSLYFPDRVVPMLPEILSDNLCSLIAGAARNTILCTMTVDPARGVVSSSFAPAVIRVRKRLTYRNAQQILAGEDHSAGDSTRNMLRDLSTVAGILRQSRNARCPLELQNWENRYILSSDRLQVLDVIPCTPNEASQIVEECMIATNTAAAAYLAAHGENCLYRTEKAPDADKLQSALLQLSHITPRPDFSCHPTAEQINRYIRSTYDVPVGLIPRVLLARSMEKAIYSPEDQGHFALGLANYAHFTSPIRRYPDLVMHRLVKACMQQDLCMLPQANTRPSAPAAPQGTADDRSGQSDSLFQKLKNWLRSPGNAGSAGGDAHFREGAGHISPDPVPRFSLQGAWHYSRSDLSAIGQKCTELEIRGVEATREAEKWLKCSFMSGYQNQIFSGYVTSVQKYGLFVMLEENFIEGFVYIGSLGSERFTYYSDCTLRGNSTGKSFHTGQHMQVRLQAVSLSERRMRFVPV